MQSGNDRYQIDTRLQVMVNTNSYSLSVRFVDRLIILCASAVCAMRGYDLREKGWERTLVTLPT